MPLTRTEQGGGCRQKRRADELPRCRVELARFLVELRPWHCSGIFSAGSKLLAQSCCMVRSFTWRASRFRSFRAHYLLGLGLLLAPGQSHAQGLVAFPGAEGAGRFTSGGRG